MYGGIFDVEDAVELKINTVSMLKGYLDNVLPEVSNQHAAYEELIKVLGRDYGQDLANLQLTKDYYNTAVEDIFDDALTETGAEITLSALSNLSSFNLSFKDDYLLNKFTELGKLGNADFYVDDAKALQLFALADAPPSGVTLQSIAGSSTNNILRIEEIGELMGFDIRNFIKVKGAQVHDHWTEGNAGNWEGVNCTLTNETTLRVAGQTSIKGTVNVNPSAQPRIDLLFPLYNYDPYLDFSEVGSVDCSVFVHHNDVNNHDLRVYAEDDEHHVIYYSSSVSYTTPPNVWKLIKFPVGPDNTIAALATTNSWWKVGGSAFTWKIIVLGVEADGVMLENRYMILDGLSLGGIDTVALASEGAPWGGHRKRMLTLSRTDIDSQVQLQATADDELEKRRLALQKLKVTTMFQSSCHYAGQTVEVCAPSSGIGTESGGEPDTTVTYRILSLHHIAAPHVNLLKGHDAVTEFELIQHEIDAVTQKVDPLRFKLGVNPTQAQVERLEARIRSLEKT